MENWLRHGERLPDGREIFLVDSQGWICCDPEVIDRKNKGLEIPNRGDPSAADGYKTPWERRKMRKFWEGMDFGRVTNLVAYAENPVNLPDPSPGTAWREDPKFDERTAISDDPESTRVFERARIDGWATIKRLV